MTAAPAPLTVPAAALGEGPCWDAATGSLYLAFGPVAASPPAPQAHLPASAMRTVTPTRCHRRAGGRSGAVVAGNVTGMAGADGLADWLDMERGAPEIARLGAACLTRPRIAMLGTLRRDRSPRISPIEPCIVNGRLLAGAMAWSAKAADLRRDPRYVLHSTVTGPDSGEGELKLHGRAVQAGPGLRGQAPGACRELPEQV